jgi:hypothetical protein
VAVAVFFLAWASGAKNKEQTAAETRIVRADMVNLWALNGGPFSGVES